LRASLSEPGTLAAVFDFLGAHEPDLVAAADALGVPPGAFLAAGERLAR
jgi:adenine/guanine phosphoribosyltransferase-like PRPP-binding protein